MVEHPIPFTGPMVRAILAGTKTVTRRPVTIPWGRGHRAPPQTLGGRDDHNDPECWGYPFYGPIHDGYMVLARGLDQRHDHGLISIPCPYGVPGDTLWVRENWASAYARGCWGTLFQADGAFVQGARQHAKGTHYNAENLPPRVKWRPSIHIPRWAARILLEVTDVRVERVQDITEEQAMAEGMDGDCPIGSIPAYQRGPLSYHFAQSWDAIYTKGPYAWEKNPWVWVVSFRRIAE